MLKSIVEKYGETAQAEMVMEECSELIYALSKLKRASGIGYKTEETQDEAYKRVIREMAHVKNAIRSLQYILGIDERDLEMMIKESDKKSFQMTFGRKPTQEELAEEVF